MKSQTDLNLEVQSVVELTTKSREFYCTSDELEQLVKYYAWLLAELNYHKNPQYESIIREDINVEATIERRISEISEFIDKETVDKIIQRTTNEFGCQVDHFFNRGYTAAAMDRYKEYKQACSNG